MVEETGRGRNDTTLATSSMDTADNYTSGGGEYMKKALWIEQEIAKCAKRNVIIIIVVIMTVLFRSVDQEGTLDYTMHFQKFAL